MDATRKEPSSLGLLGAMAASIGWGLFILLHGVESYALGMAGRPWPFERPDSQDGALVLVVLSVVCLSSSFLVGSFLEAWTRYDPPVRWLRRLRFALTLIPLLGLYVVPFWSWLTDAKPSWAFAEPGRRPAESRALTGALQFSRAWYLRLSSVFLFSLVALNAIALQVLLAWLLSPDWPDDIRSQALAGVRLALRTTGFITTIVPTLLFYRWGRISHRAFPLAVLCCLAWLAPWPFYAIALASGFWGLDRKKKPLLSTIAYAGRSRLSQRLERGGGMDWWKVSLWRRWRFGWLAEIARTRTTETRLTLLYRVKTFLLILDTAALVLVLGRFAQNQPILDASVARVTRLAASLFLAVPDSAVLLLPVLFFLVARGAEALRPPVAPDPLLPWRYLLLTLGAVLIGAQQGAVLLGGYYLDLAVSLLHVGYVASVSIFVLSIPFNLKSAPRSYTLSSIMPWVILFVHMNAIGECMIDDEEMAKGIVRVLELCALLAPAWALAAGLAWVSSLIEPFHPRDLWSPRLAAKSRSLLALLILSSVLPFGGLATPLWRRLRSRLLRASLHAGKA
jgi:hypothetical protein